MPKFDGAIVKEQGITFAIIVVAPSVLKCFSRYKENVRKSYSRFFPNTHIILMSQDNKGVPTYQGNRNIIKFLLTLDPKRIHWQTFSY